MAGRPWYAFYPDAYERDAAHLSYVQDSAYRRMLDHYYKTGEPLPLDKETIYRACRAMRREERQAIDYCLKTFFVEGDDGWHQTRADAEIVRAAEVSAKRADAANKRHNKNHANAYANAPPFAEQLDTHSTTTATSSEAKASSEKALTRPDPVLGASKLPDFVPKIAWAGYVEMRRRIRAPLTPRAVDLTIAKLEKLHAAGEDIGTVLDLSTQNSWRGVFPVKQDGKANGQGRQGSSANDKFLAASRSLIGEFLGSPEGGDDSGPANETGRPLLSA